jgi:endonuclease G, mitochondrial
MKIGYSPTFLERQNIDLPRIERSHSLLKNNVTLHYTHFSVIFSKDRKQPVCTAVNIDGKEFVEIKRKEKADKWVFDKTIQENEQLGHSFYSNTNADFHKGHIVRRLDPSWGNNEEAARGEKDTFHYTNASPQHREFNPKIWLELERNVLEKGAVSQDEKITVFAGPVLSPADKPFIKLINEDLVFIPNRFWKIIIWNKTDGRTAAVGFMQSQETLIQRWLDQGYGKDRDRGALDDYFENMKFKNEAVYQVNISDIQNLTGLSFSLEDTFLPNVKEKMKELTIGIQKGSKYAGRYRGSSNEEISVDGLVLE